MQLLMDLESAITYFKSIVKDCKTCPKGQDFTCSGYNSVRCNSNRLALQVLEEKLQHEQEKYMGFK